MGTFGFWNRHTQPPQQEHARREDPPQVLSSALQRSPLRDAPRLESTENQRESRHAQTGEHQLVRLEPDKNQQ